MGRPLKIQKFSPNSGVGSPGAGVAVDQGFPNFGSLTAPVLNSDATLTDSQFLGVVGGAPSAATSSTYPRVQVDVNIVLASGAAAGAATGYILRQKGAHKYLVADATARTAVVAGNAYRVTVVGDTDWAAAGVKGTATVGTIFTATAAIANTGTGRVHLVGVCVLSNAASPTAGNMSVAYTDDLSSEFYLSKLTNKFLLDWQGGSDYTAESVVADKRFATNFFSDDGTVIKSGTTAAANTGTVENGQQNLLDIAIVQNSTATS
jgi:hypothetical protein